MLVSTIITMAQNLANVPNTTFWTATEQLQAAQLAWEIIYAFLMKNDDDYYVNDLYLPGPTATNGTTVTLTGNLDGTTGQVTNLSSTSNLTLRMVATDTTNASYITAGSQIKSIDSATQVTLNNVTTHSATGDSITFTLWTADSNRSYTSYMTLPYDFYRLRMMQYQSTTGSTVSWFPFWKETTRNYGNTQNTPSYRFKGTYLTVYDPSQFGLYDMWYYPPAATLTTASDISYPASVVPETMSYLLAAEIRRKMHADPTPWLQKANELMGTMVVQKSRDDATAITPKNIFEDTLGLWGT